ncbi:MAG: 1-acyl-sn-glycerol-3-phosphate acyltransferase [Desulfobulbaceae bacterium]|nr:MAG: 1-acyl-sn-glycerol-3-phosphate acyltransferase [Desulfobulbaceae bacterium]
MYEPFESLVKERRIMRTIIWYSYFWMYMFCSIFMYIPVIFLSLFQLKAWRNRYIQMIVGNWARSLIWLAGGTITINGSENLPHTQHVCYVANHQGNFDIPIMIGFLPGPIGFMAKKELVYMPIVNLWMLGIGCVFINRENRRASVDSINRGIENIKAGNPMVIFPEGTRSQGPEPNVFRPGSLKLATRSEAVIVPVTISGSYKLKELHKKFHPGQVDVTIHQPITPEDYQDLNSKDLSKRLSDTITEALP